MELMMWWFKGYTRIRMNIEGDPDGATEMPLTLQWRSLPACSISR